MSREHTVFGVASNFDNSNDDGDDHNGCPITSSDDSVGRVETAGPMAADEPHQNGEANGAEREPR